MNFRPLLAAASLLSVAACDMLPFGPGGAGEVGLRFQAVTSQPSTTSGASFALSAEAAGEGLLIDGSNGVLRIDDVRFIVAEFEVERDDDHCEGLEDEAEEQCEESSEYEAPPAFVQLPLSGSAVGALDLKAPEGEYTEMKFKVEDIDFEDELDEDDASDIQALAKEVHALFPEWPKDASMVMIGAFTPAGATEARPFKAFFKAEIEIEREFDAPTRLGTGGEAITVSVDPALWLKQIDGSVLDLSKYDFASTGQVLEFEFELGKGFSGVEIDD